MYNQSEEKKIIHQYVNYLNIEDKKSAFMEELNQDRDFFLYEGAIISKRDHLERNFADIVMSPVEWCEEMLKELYNCTKLDTELLAKFRPKRTRRKRVKIEKKNRLNSTSVILDQFIIHTTFSNEERNTILPLLII